MRSFRKIKKNRMVEKDSKVVPDWRIWREMGERTKYLSEKWQGLWGPRSMKSPISDAWDRWVSTGLLSMAHSWDPVWTAIEAVSVRASGGNGNNWAGVQLCRSSSSGKHYWFCHVWRSQPETAIAVGFSITSQIYWGLLSAKHFADNLIHWKGCTLSRLMNRPVSGGVLVENANRGDIRW